MEMASLSTRLTNSQKKSDNAKYGTITAGRGQREKKGLEVLFDMSNRRRAAPEMDPFFFLLAALAAVPESRPDRGGVPSRLSFSVSRGVFSLLQQTPGPDGM